MARNNMNFSASLRLNTKDFKKGIADVQRTLNGLKNSFLSLSAALGAGLGFSKIISNAKDTAQQLSVAKAVLHNVSQEVDDAGYKWDSYASNLNYVKKISKEYGQDLTNLIEGFGQFHAAANLVLDANGKVALSLEDQKYIYEQLTRAAAGYHMSADRTKDMMNAITQMMSKGKVAAEELRRQLGNSLPGAFGLMATAMGVTTTELEDMMRKGQVLSADALPKFAKELEKVTKDMSFDSLQQSLNRLKNSWTELVEGASVEDMYKKIVDASNGLLSWINGHMSETKGMIRGALAGLVAYFTSDVIVKMVKGVKTVRAEWVSSLDTAIQKVQALEKGAEKVNNVFKRGKAMDASFANAGKAKGPEDFDNWRKGVAYAKQYNDALKERDVLLKKVQGKGVLSKEDYAVIKNVEKIYKKIHSDATLINGATGFWAKTWGTIRGYATAVWATVKGIAVQMGAMLIIGALVGIFTKIVEKQKEMKKYAEETAKIFSDYQADIEKIDTTEGEQIINLKTQLKILGECEQGSKEWAGAVQEINNKLGLQGNDMLTIESKYDDIVKAVNRWIERLKLVAKINRNITHQQEAEEQAEDIRSQIRAKAAEYKSKTGYELGGFMDLETGSYNKDQLAKGNIKRKSWIEREVRPLITRLGELKKVSDAADASISELTKDLYKNYGTTTDGGVINTTSGDTNNDKKVSDIRKVYDTWKKESKELENKLREHAISEEEYQEEFDKLIKKSYDSAAETGKLSIDAILKKADKGKTLTAMEKWYKDLYESAGEAAQRILIKEASDAISKSIDEAIDEMDNMLKDQMEDWIEQSDKTIKSDLDNLMREKPKLGTRDMAFDYKKSESDKSSEQLDVTKENIKLMEDYINDVVGSYDKWSDACDAVKKRIEDARKILAKMKQEASTLEQVMKIQQIDEDIKKLGEDIGKAVTGGIKDIAQSTDRLVKGIKSVGETLDDPKATEWEQLTAVFNEVIQIVDTLISLYETFNTISQLSNTLQEAKNSRQAEMNRLLTEEIGLRLLLQKIQQGNLSDTEKQIIADIVASKAAKTKQAAKSGEAVAGATAAGAELPFPYNLAAIAAGVASVLAALSSASKFAEGGIVGGNSYSGDKQMARVNSGELILNRAQQGNLYNMIKNGTGGRGPVDFRIRGCDLIGVIRNEQNRMKG